MLQQDVGDAQPLQECGRPVGGLVGKLLEKKKKLFRGKSSQLGRRLAKSANRTPVQRPQQGEMAQATRERKRVNSVSQCVSIYPGAMLEKPTVRGPGSSSWGPREAAILHPGPVGSGTVENSANSATLQPQLPSPVPAF